MVGIISYGVYIPKYRLKISEIASVWNKSGVDIVKSLGVTEKSVPGIDEDAVTLAIEAAIRSLETSELKPSDIEVLLVGSESHPYAVNPTSTTVGEFLGIGNRYLAADLQFACKAATAGIQAVAGLVAAGQIKQGMVIGSDTAQSKPHDVLEYTSAAAAAAYTLGNKNILAKLLAYTSYSSDTPDFWRRDGMRYPIHAGRFTGLPAYFAHVQGAATLLMRQARLTPEDVDYCVFHMPNGKFPLEVARRLKFTPEQLAPSLVVSELGNPYSASSLIALAKVLDQARPGEKIFMVSYGSGAGADAFLWETTAELTNSQRSKNNLHTTVMQQLEEKTFVNYIQYLQKTHKI